MGIGEVCNREVVIVERSASVPDAAKLMRKHHVGDLVVVEELEGRRRPVGIVTDRDLVLEVVAMDLAADGLTVGDVMAPELVTVREREGVFEAMRYMRERGVRRVPVVDDQGWLVGIVTLDDLVELLAEEMNELARLIGHGIRRESDARAL